MSQSSSPAQTFAAQLLATLAKAGVRNFFLAPGARSQSLAIAAGQLADAGKIDLHIRLDERGMGFTALGSALALKIALEKLGKQVSVSISGDIPTCTVSSKATGATPITFTVPN